MDETQVVYPTIKPKSERIMKAGMNSLLRLYGIVTLLGLQPLGLKSLVAASPTTAGAFPGAVGYGGVTAGGRGGQIVRVTTLEPAGPGSLTEALQTKGPRLIVFEVGGVIDLAGKSLWLKEPWVTIVGQTAPPPGITIIKGPLYIGTHDVIIQHLRIRPGEAGHAKKSGWEVDAMSTSGAARVTVDHCSLTWATDEGLSASGERVKGSTPEEWRANTSHDITFSNCIVAENLAHSTHTKGEHSKGTLIHDNVTNILITGNLYASNMERNPLAKPGVRAVIANNWIANPGKFALHAGGPAEEWLQFRDRVIPAQLAVVGNVVECGPNSSPKMAFFFCGKPTPPELFLEDNIALNLERKPLPEVTGTHTRLKQRPFWPEGFQVMPAAKVKDYVAKNAGVFPRDAIDTRIVQSALEGKGRIIDSEQEAGGYPELPATRAIFKPAEWNLDTMQRRQQQ